MGDKRMILSAYSIFVFERAGFHCVGNVVWDKGEIEGKRAFNGGNFSPYYQAPFNCWEHILVFQKPGSNSSLKRPFPSLLKQKPVLKMVNGSNRHGHSAPFPDAIPLLLAERLQSGSTILDPYAGSMTTGRAAMAAGCKAICIERDSKYFSLGRRAISGSQPQLALAV
jgi:DNA modification methylase